MYLKPASLRMHICKAAMAQICPELGVSFVLLNYFPLQGRDSFFD